MQQIGLDAVLNNVPDFTAGINTMNQGVDSFAQNSTKQGQGFAGGFGEIVTGALRQIGTLAVDALLKAGQAVAGFVKDSIGLAGDFQAGMLEFQSVAGKGVDTKGLEQFHDLFLQLGKDLPVSTSDVQKAAIEMVKGGIDPATIAAGGLKQNIQFAAAAMAGDLVKAAEISSKIMGGWAGVGATATEKADFLTHATDLLARAANASTTDVEGLSLGIFNAQGTARTAGVSFDDLTTSLAALAPRFESSAVAGNSLKNFIIRMQPTTQPAIDAMTDLGLYTEATGSKFYDAQGNFIGFQAAAQLLQDSLKGLTNEQKQSKLQTIFQSDAMGAAAGFAELGAAGYQEMADSLANANGVMDAAALKQQGFNTSLDNAKGSVEALQITLGEKLLPIMGTLLDDYIAPFVNSLTDLASAVFGDDEAFNKLNPTMQEIAKTITGLADAFSQGGLSGLIDALIKDIKAAIPDIEKALLDWGEAFVDWIAPMIPPALKALGDMADQAWNWVKAQAPGWGKQLLTWGNELVTWVAPMIPPALAELGKLGTQFLGWIGDQAQPLLKKFNDWATSFIAWIVPATVTFLAEWPKMFDQFLEWIGNEAGPLLKKLGDWALAFIQWIAPMIPPFLVALAGVALAMVTWIGETAVVLALKIKDKFLPAIIGWIVTDAVPGLYKALESIWKVFQDWISDTERQLAQSMRAVGASIIEGIKRGIADAWESLKGWLSAKIKSLYNVGQDAQDGGSPAMLWAPVGGSIIEGIMLGIEQGWPALTDQIGSIADGLIDKMKDIGSRMQDAVADGFGATASIDRQIARNLDKFKDILPQYQQYTTGALKEAQQQATEFADPAQGAKFFKMRSDQILEYAKLQKDLSEAETQDDRDRITAQMLLINKAQTAEISQFDATKAATSPLMDIVSQINEIMKTISGINLTDDQIKIVSQLSAIWAQLQTPVTTQRTPYNPNVPGPVSNVTNLNMPIYSSQSPTVLRDSMAIAGAALL